MYHEHVRGAVLVALHEAGSAQHVMGVVLRLHVVLEGCGDRHLTLVAAPRCRLTGRVLVVVCVQVHVLRYVPVVRGEAVRGVALPPTTLLDPPRIAVSSPANVMCTSILKS